MSGQKLGSVPIEVTCISVTVASTPLPLEFCSANDPKKQTFSINALLVPVYICKSTRNN